MPTRIERYTGHVDSIQAAAEASLQPAYAENAVGNFGQVVQSVPVKILFKRPANTITMAPACQDSLLSVSNFTVRMGSDHRRIFIGPARRIIGLRRAASAGNQNE